MAPDKKNTDRARRGGQRHPQQKNNTRGVHQFMEHDLRLDEKHLIHCPLSVRTRIENDLYERQSS